MKLTDKNEQHSFITDNDITVTTSQDKGNSLTSVLSKHSDDINKLKSNVKWIYQNGGVGGGGYGGNSSNNDWSASVTLNYSEILSEDTLIILPSSGTFQLVVHINNPAGQEFQTEIYYDIDDPTKSKKLTERLSINNGWECKKNLNITSNNSLEVKIIDSNNVQRRFKCKYITTPFTLDSYLIFGDNSRINDNIKENILISDIKKTNGLNLKTDIDISVQGQCFYRFTDINGTTSTTQKFNSEEDGQKISYLTFDIFNANSISDNDAGEYSVTFTFEYNRDGQAPIVINKTLTFTIIPDTFYVQLKPETKGAIFYKEPVTTQFNENTDEENIFKNTMFFEGSIVFTCKVFWGNYDERTFKNFYLYLDGNKYNLSFNQIEERKATTISITSGDISQKDSNNSYIPHQLEISVAGESKTFYFYVKSQNTDITWYEWDKLSGQNFQNDHFINFFRLNGTACGLFSSLQNQSVLKLNNSNYNLEFKGVKSEDTWNNINITANDGFDVFFSVGLQLSGINDFSTPLVCLKNTFTPQYTGGNDIYIYQNKVVFGDESLNKKINIFIPFNDAFDEKNNSNYHLLTICRRFIFTENTKKYFEIIVYLDGVIEGSLQECVSFETYYNEIIINPLVNNKCTLFAINHLELSFFAHNDKTRKQRLGEKTNDYLLWMDDINVTRYWYKYYQTIHNDIESKNELAHKILLLNFFSSIDVKETKYITEDGTTKLVLNEDSNNIFTSFTQQQLNNICENSKIPSICLTFKSADGFLEWLTASETAAENSGQKKVSVLEYWGGNGQNPITYDPGNLGNTYFYVELQGSSTYRFTIKNMELCIASNQTDSSNPTIPVFTPNFSIVSSNDTETDIKQKYKTFLPESSFTLKADLVDSSHSNNTSLGEFINDNTEQFNTNNSNSEFNPYIKNCLLGFKIQLFVKIVDDDNTTTDEIYYIGIYNFNLGRKSHFNLGYLNIDDYFSLHSSDASEKAVLENGFKIYNITPPSIQEGLFVAEISGGDNLYDFSQFHRSILIGDESGDNAFTGMFGDFVLQYSSIYAQEAEKYKICLQNFVKAISRAGGYIFDKLQKNYGNISYGFGASEYDLKLEKNPEDKSGNPFISINQVPDYRTQYLRKRENGDIKNVETTKESDASQFDLINLLVDDIETNKRKYLNYTSLVEYYTICMTFGLLDSVQKNLNVKTWTISDSSKNQTTFYLAFYDMDTCLGIDNNSNDASFFTFSDFWFFDSESDDNTAKIFRDFYPNHNKVLSSTHPLAQTKKLEIGFDIPSSFLFAIAKYAKLFDTETDAGSLLDLGTNQTSFPGNLYASWRNKNGVLANANKFITNYFGKELNNISECSLNINYRTKYLTKQFDRTTEKLQFIKTNFTSFKGKRLNNVENWLNDRLHILDGYFNLSRVSIPIQTYNKNPKNGEKTINDLIDNGRIIYEYKIDANYVDSDNTDILILRDIFTSPDSKESGQNYNGSPRINVRGKNNTILNLVSGEQINSIYFLDDPQRTFQIYTGATGQTQIVLGGTQQLLYIDNISSVITNNKQFTIYSNSITNLYGDAGECNAWTLSLPFVTKIELLSPNYSGELKIIEPSSFLSLEKINISNTKINLTVGDNTSDKQIFVKEIIAENVNATNFYLFNCPNLSKLTWKHCVFENVFLNRIPTNEFILDGSLSKDDINIKNRLSLYGGNREEYTVTIRNISGIQEIEIFGNCTQINISNCYNLNKVTIEKPELVKTLSITYCNTDGTNFELNSQQTVDKKPKNIPGWVNLTGFTNIEFNKLSFINTNGIYCISLPNKDFILTKNSINGTGIKFLDTFEGRTVFLQGDSMFYNCTKLSFKKCKKDFNKNDKTEIFTAVVTEEDTYENYIKDCINIKIDYRTTSLNYTFGNHNYPDLYNFSSKDIEYFCDIINTEYPYEFIKGVDNDGNYIKEELQTYKPESIISINWLFHRIKTIDYTQDEFINDIKNKQFKYSLKNLIKVNSACDVFCCTFYGLHKYIFEGLGSNVTGIIDIRGFAWHIGGLHKDTFTGEIIKHLQYLPWHSGDIHNGRSVNIIDDNGKTISEHFFAYELFNTCDELLEFRNFSINNASVDYSCLFTKERFPKLKQILYSFRPNSSNTNISFANIFKYNKADLNERYLTETNEELINKINIIDGDSQISIENIFHSFNFTNSEIVFDLLDLFNESGTNFGNGILTQILKSSYLHKFSQEIANSTPSVYCMNFKKYIEKDNFTKIFKYCLDNKDNITSLNNLFVKAFINISIKNVDGTFTNDIDSEFNTNVKNGVYLDKTTSLYNLFNGLSFIKVKDINSAFTTNTIDDINTYFERIPIKLTSNTTKIFPNVTSFIKTFANIQIDSNLPFDFFNKRKLTGRNAYVVVFDENDERYFYKKELKEDGNGEMIEEYIQTDKTYCMNISLPCTLYSYNYTRNIKNLSYCFENVTILNNNSYSFDPNTIITIDDNDTYSYNHTIDRILCDFGDNNFTYIYSSSYSYTLSYFEYNDPTLNSNLCDITLNSEITDLMDISGFYTENINIKALDDNDNYQVTNWPCFTSDVNRLIYPPDILYGVSNETIADNINLYRTFNNFNGVGVLPRNLLKHAKKYSIRDTFRNNFVIPQLLYSFPANGTDPQIDNYYYVPSYFTEYSLLSNSFNFKLNVLPGDYGSKYNNVFVFDYNSIPKNTQLLKNSLPTYLYNSLFSQKLMNTNNKYEIYNTYNQNIRYNITGKIVFNEETSTYNIEYGLDLSYFDNLQLYDIIDPISTQLIYNNVINENYTLTYNVMKNKVSSASPFIRSCEKHENPYNEQLYGISKNIILPSINNCPQLANGIIYSTSSGHYPSTLSKTNNITDQSSAKYYTYYSNVTTGDSYFTSHINWTE